MMSKGSHVNKDSSLRNWYQRIQIIFIKVENALYPRMKLLPIVESCFKPQFLL